jgi:hypothetical protein
MQKRRTTVALACMVLAAMLAACKQEERNRPTSYEKGVYGGETGTALSAEQKQALRQRSRLQRGGGL